MKVVLDTNVIISGILGKESPPARVLNAWLHHKFDLVTSPDLVREYFEVFSRKKFAFVGSAQKRLHLLEELLAFPWVNLVYPREKVEAIHSDPKDNMVLECAITGEVDFVVSGDSHLLSLREFKGVSIVSPGEFVQVLFL